MNSQKKVWTKPVLIVIGRGKPEERVLAVCKTDLAIIDGPNGKCNDNTPCSTAADS